MQIRLASPRLRRKLDSMAGDARKPRVVIVGGGFAGAYCAQALAREARRGRMDVTIVDRNNYFVFYPLLVEAGTGSLHPRHAVVSIREFTGDCAFRMGEVIDVDMRGQEVLVEAEETRERLRIPYDHLVLAPGSVTRLPDVPGLAEHAYQIKSLGDAVALRDRAIRLLEAAEATKDPSRRRALMHMVVVGGNYTGVEVAGEFHVFLREACREFPSLDRDEVRVTLVEIADRILPALDEDLAGYAAERMRRRGIDIRLGTSARGITPETVELRDGESLRAHTTIWCAGIAPSPLIARLGLPVDERGYVLAEPDMRVQGYDNVWAIGDSAVNPDPDGRPYPPTAQHAVRQGQGLAANLARVVAGEPATPFVYEAVGSLAALGCRTGVAKILGVKLSGFPAWFLWRTVYLFKMPGLSRKIRVALDWTLDLFFRRDVVQLGVHRR
jgi:NADH dehydrogenase